MIKKDLTKIFLDEIYSTPPKKNYKTKINYNQLDEIYSTPPKKNYETKIIYNQLDEIWSIDLADMVDYKTSNDKGYRYIFKSIDKFSKYFWAKPLKSKYGRTITDEISKILSSSKRSPVKIESNRGSEFYNSILQNFVKSKNVQHYSRFTDKGPSVAECVIRTVRNFLKKPVFLAGNADRLFELPSVIKQFKNTIHHSIKMTPNEASKKSKERKVYSNLQDRRVRQKPKFKLGQPDRTADIKGVFSKGDSTNYSYKLQTITEVIHDTIPSYRINYLPERYNENLLLPSKLFLDENNQVMKELNLTQ